MSQLTYWHAYLKSKPYGCGLNRVLHLPSEASRTIGQAIEGLLFAWCRSYYSLCVVEWDGRADTSGAVAAADSWPWSPAMPGRSKREGRQGTVYCLPNLAVLMYIDCRSTQPSI